MDVGKGNERTGPGVEVPTLYLFSLEWDVPLSGRGLSDLVALNGQPLPHADDKANLVGGAVFDSEQELRKRGYVEHAAASGVLLSPKYLLTNRHVVQSRDNDLSYTLTRFREDGSSELVGGRVIKWSVVHEEDLALVELARRIDSIVPVPLRQKRLRQGEQLTVIGFPDVFSRGEHIEATSGSFLNEDAKFPWVYTSNLMEDGIGGGPCLDMSGNLVGLAFAKSDFKRGQFVWRRNVRVSRSHYDHTVAISNDAIVEFMKIVDPSFEFEEEVGVLFDSRQHLAETVRDSVMLVKSWKAPKNNVHEVRPDFVPKGGAEERKFKRGKPAAELASIRRKRLFPDMWCMSCSGTGKIRCLTCAGSGKIQFRETIDTGNRNGAGMKIYKPVWSTKRCTACNRRPIRECPHCDDGKLSFK